MKLNYIPRAIIYVQEQAHWKTKEQTIKKTPPTEDDYRVPKTNIGRQQNNGSIFADHVSKSTIPHYNVHTLHGKE